VLNSTGDTIQGNTFENVSKGVLLDVGSTKITIANNVFHDIAAAAIGLTPTSGQNTVTGNTISQSGMVYRDGGAIQITESQGNSIAYNLIQNVPRFGIEEQNYGNPPISNGVRS
jgi:nitrous oxidase accessory protein NosD